MLKGLRDARLTSSALKAHMSPSLVTDQKAGHVDTKLVARREKVYSGKEGCDHYTVTVVAACQYQLV